MKFAPYAMLACWFAWAAFGPNLVTSLTLRVFIYVAIFACHSLIWTALLTRYERTGQAVRLPVGKTRPNPRSSPKPPLAVQIACVVLIALLLLLGVAPIAETRALFGIVTCVLALFALAFLAFFLGRLGPCEPDH